MEASDFEPGTAPESKSLPTWRYQMAVMRHYRPVYGYAATILGVSADAEDVTQEAFLRYLQNGGDVRKPREWLIRVARNLCMDRLRAGSRVTELVPEIEESLHDHDGPGIRTERAELSARLGRLIDGLPEPQRSLVVLFDIQGMTGAECAEILGISVNQVKVYLHRGRRRLRQRLEESDE